MIKGIKKKKEFHVSPDKKGKGDHYGIGVKNPIGKSISIMGGNPISKKKLNKPPKSLA